MLSVWKEKSDGLPKGRINCLDLENGVVFLHGHISVRISIESNALRLMDWSLKFQALAYLY